MYLFRDYGPSGEPGTWTPFHAEPSELEGIRTALRNGVSLNPDDFPESPMFKIRALSMDEETEIDRRGRDLRESMRVRIKGRNNKDRDADAEFQIDRAAELERKIQRAILATVDLSVKLRVETTDSAADWGKALGRPVAVGELILRGNLTEEAKRKVITWQEPILAFVLRVTDKLKTEADESLEDETKN